MINADWCSRAWFRALWFGDGHPAFSAVMVLWYLDIMRSSLAFIPSPPANGIHVGPLLAGLGIGGIAIALAVQAVLSDLLASISIALDKPFGIGDFLTIDDCMGTIEHIGVKSTRMRSLTGEQIILGNSDLLKSRLRNFGRMMERRAVEEPSLIGRGLLPGRVARRGRACHHRFAAR